VVFDDYRTEHCPGTAAAVWEAMATDGLKAVCVSANKFYGTWGDPKAVQDELIEYVPTSADYRCDIQQVMGQRLIRDSRSPPKSARPVLAKGGSIDARRRRCRAVAVALLPPFVVSAVRKRRGARSLGRRS